MKIIYAVEIGAPYSEEYRLLALCESMGGAIGRVEAITKRRKSGYKADDCLPNTWSDGYYTITIREKDLLP